MIWKCGAAVLRFPGGVGAPLGANTRLRRGARIAVVESRAVAERTQHGFELLADADDQLSAQDTQVEGGSEPPGWLEPPFALGRYVVSERLGRGGAGAVFRAHDPELARDVAIKVVRSRGRSDDARQRLLGEAQAIAKLSHPNVVAVYDVGELPVPGGSASGVYMVMELLEGATLRGWLRAAPRSRDRVLDVLIAAGRGLAAAHRANLVHRDFKPDNLAIGDEPTGLPRVHVLDFGLALAAIDPSSGDDAAAESSAAIEIAGTPGYMAPEQHVGEPTDARTDLFAFCVTAWEALHGEHPYRGRTLAELERAKRSGPPPAPTRRVPGWLHDAIARGLAPDPARRPVSMTALLDGIERRRQRRRKLAIAGVVGSLAAGAFALAWTRGPDARECITAGEQRLDEVWNEARRAGARERFAAVGLPYADDSWARVQSVLDARVAQWRSVRRQSCEAALRDGADGVEQAAASLRCLDEQLDELGARVELLAHADRDVVSRAARMAERMPSSDRCLDAALLARERGDTGGGELEAELVRGRLQHELGHYEAAMAAALAVAATAEQAGDHRRRARALLQVCRSEIGLRKSSGAPASCTDAWVAAERAGASNLAISAMLDLLGQTRTEQQEEADRLERLIRARMEAQGSEHDEPWVGSELALAIAQRHRALGRWQEAEREAQHAYELMVEHRGADDPAVVPALNELALDAQQLGAIDRSHELFEQALAIMIASRGRDHPDVVSLENNLAGLEIALGRHDEALQRLAKVRAAKQAIDGVATPWQLTTMYQQVEALVALDRGAEAVTLAHEELVLAERTHGAESSELLADLVALTWSLRASDRCGEALEVLARIESIGGKSTTRDPEIDAVSELERARCLGAVGRVVEAGASHVRALERMIQLYGERGRPVAEALLAQARWQREHADVALARASLERARDICSATEGDPSLDRRITDELASLR
jgi:eukaryotic-like serine/threonine-protein kinase